MAVATCRVGKNYDIKPVAQYDSDKNVWDAPITDGGVINIETLESVADNICAEYWVYGDTMAACVKIVGNLRRLFTTTDTGTTPNDLPWNYVAYQMHAMIGETAADYVVQDVLQWPEQTVDFNNFNKQADAVYGLSSVGVLAISALCMFVF